MPQAGSARRGWWPPGRLRESGAFPEQATSSRPSPWRKSPDNEFPAKAGSMGTIGAATASPPLHFPPAAREGTAGSPRRMHPPFSFRLAEKKAGRAWSKRKGAGCQTLRLRRKVWQGRGSCESVCPGLEAPSSLRPTRPAKNCVPASESAEHGRGGDLNRRISIPAHDALPRRAPRMPLQRCR